MSILVKPNPLVREISVSSFTNFTILKLLQHYPISGIIVYFLFRWYWGWEFIQVSTQGTTSRA
jgi:hypothetical protein